MVLVVSLLLAGGGTAYLLAGGKLLGAAAFGGVNLLALIFWALTRARMDRMIREQTPGEAAVSWILSIVWSVGVVVLYDLGYTLAGSAVIGLTALLFLLSAWAIAYGPEPGPGAERDG
jgi:uncharacterized membrane protein YwzB